MLLRMLTCGESVIIDQATNRATIVNVLEQVTSSKFPFIIPALTVFALWERENDTAEISVPIEFSITLNDKPVMQATIEARFENTKRSRTVINVGGIPIAEPGNLVIKVQHETITGEWTVEISNQP